MDIVTIRFHMYIHIVHTTHFNQLLRYAPIDFAEDGCNHHSFAFTIADVLCRGAEYLTALKRKKKKGKKKSLIRNMVLALRICFSYWSWSAIQRDELSRSIYLLVVYSNIVDNSTE